MSTPRTDETPHSDAATELDLVIMGAGLSGIGAAYRVQTECPDVSFAILEARDVMGGTWDLFRYPGVRSDSDMFTLGYPFRPWRGEKSITDGESILEYIRDTADEFGITDKIRYRTKIIAADFSTTDARWTLVTQETGIDGTVSERTIRCRFLYSCAGYYNYEKGYSPDIPGLDTFAGTVAHPQFWPSDLDYTNKRVVVIGSGATAVTLVPSMAATAAHVTMLQRSPTWISAVPSRDKIADRIRALLPPRVAHRVIRTKNILFSIGFYQFCQRRPQAARKLLTKLSTRILGNADTVAAHLTPSYDPWDQRLCAIPNADLFRAMKKGDAEIVTERIESVVPEGIRLESGRILPADLIVTATGLELLAFGGLELRVDGAMVELSEQFVWQGAMMTGVPNFAICIGYTNASWTLRADLTSRLVCKVMKHMERNNFAAVVPTRDPSVGERPLLDLAAGYVQRSIDAFPRQGDRRPWKVRQNYLIDSATTLRTNLHKTLTGIPPAIPAPTHTSVSMLSRTSRTISSRSRP